MNEEIQIEKITEKNVDDIKYENIKMFSFAYAGAMGDPGEIVFAHFDKELKFYSINWNYDPFMDEVDKKFFKPFAIPFKENDYGYLPTLEGWRKLELGMGNFLLIREEEYKQFEKVANTYDDECLIYPSLLYREWMTIAKICYKKEK